MISLRDIVYSTETLEYRYNFISETDLRYIFATLNHISDKLGKSYLAEYLFVILKEMLINSIRACAKRHYFKINRLDIYSSKDYDLGIEKFKDEVILNWSEKKDFLKDSEYYVKLSFFYDQDGIKILISNNVSLLPIEETRIKTRLEAANKYNSILEAFQDFSDTQESAGLGIVMVILLLKNLGLSRDSLKIYSEKNQTFTEINIPKEIFEKEIESEIKDKIISNIQMLPSLPDSLKKIMDMCKSENLVMSKLAAEIEKNPSLSADLLKLSNSTSFITRVTVKNILQATKIVGSNNILSMLYAVSSYKLMKEKYPKMEKEWEHANKTSLFASKLANENGYSKFAEVIAVGGLLHDIGKILLLSVESDLMKKIADLVKNKSIESSKVLEESFIGVSHTEIGRMLAQKWNYPEELVQMIEFHHSPTLSNEKYKSLVEIVYLANVFANYDNISNNFLIYDIEILEKFEIKNQEDFIKKQTQLEKYYQANKSNPMLD